MKIARKLALFAIGGGTYVGLELLWRRRSHVSMFAAGGLCFLLIGKLRQISMPWPLRAAAGAGIITAVELGTGLLVNRDHRVWDYREQWGNVGGQICPLFIAIWFPMGMLAGVMYTLTERGLDRVGGIRKNMETGPR